VSARPPHAIRRALVTGATGAVGPALVRRLVREGVPVAGVARHDPPAGLLPGGVQFTRADLTDSRAAASLVQDADLVFHLAARLHIPNPPPSMRADFERENVEVTRSLVTAAGPATRFILFSTIDVYGPTRAGELADERTAPRPRSLYGETKLQAERIVLAHPRGAVLRVASVYGPRVKGNFARLVRAVRRGRFVTVGHGQNRRTLVYDDDLAEAAWLAAKDDRSSGRVYNVTDGAIHTVDEIAAAIAEAAGRPPSIWHLPAPPVRLAARVLERGCSIVGREAPVTVAMIDKVQEDFAVAGDLIQKELGFRPAVGLRQGWARALEEMGASNPTA
jgi:UDP-glucose 4-epimerase